MTAAGDLADWERTSTRLVLAWVAWLAFLLTWMTGGTLWFLVVPFIVGGLSGGQVTRGTLHPDLIAGLWVPVIAGFPILVVFTAFVIRKNKEAFDQERKNKE